MYIQKLKYIDTAAFIYICAAVPNGKRKPRKKKLFPNPFSPFGSLLFACFLMKKQSGYPFANGLKGLNRLDHLCIWTHLGEVKIVFRKLFSIAISLLLHKGKSSNDIYSLNIFLRIFNNYSIFLTFNRDIRWTLWIINLSYIYVNIQAIFEVGLYS